MTTNPKPLRYIAFPPLGEVTEVRMTAEELAALRLNDPRWRDALDVTPRPMAVAVNVALGLNTWWRMASTPLRCFPCHECADGTARWAVCPECNGSRRVPTVAWVVK